GQGSGIISGTIPPSFSSLVHTSSFIILFRGESVFKRALRRSRSSLRSLLAPFPLRAQAFQRLVRSRARASEAAVDQLARRRLPQGRATLLRARLSNQAHSALAKRPA